MHVLSCVTGVLNAGDVISNIPYEEDFIRIDAGQNSSCGLTTNGRVLCWDDDGEERILSYLSGLHMLNMGR